MHHILRGTVGLACRLTAKQRRARLRPSPYRSPPLCQIPAVVLPHLSSQISESLDLPRRGDDLEHAVRVARQAVDGLVAVSVDGLDAAKPLKISFEDCERRGVRPFAYSLRT